MVRECELISTGKFVIHVDEDEPKASDTTRVTEEVKQAQREAKKDAERIVAEEDRPDTNEMSEGRSADRSYIPSNIGICQQRGGLSQGSRQRWRNLLSLHCNQWEG